MCFVGIDSSLLLFCGLFVLCLLAVCYMGRPFAGFILRRRTDYNLLGRVDPCFLILRHYGSPLIFLYHIRSAISYNSFHISCFSSILIHLRYRNALFHLHIHLVLCAVVEPRMYNSYVLCRDVRCLCYSVVISLGEQSPSV